MWYTDGTAGAGDETPQAVYDANVLRHDFLNDISETRTSCGFRENMIQEANKPCDAVALGWLVCGIFESLIQKCITYFAGMILGGN